MEKTVRQLIKELQSLKPELQDMPVKVLAENGELYSPEIKTILKDPLNIWDKSKENVEAVFLGI